MVPSKLETFYADVLTQIQNHKIIAFGGGLIVEQLITEIAKNKLDLQVISSSNSTSNVLKKFNIPEIELNHTNEIPLYIGEGDAYNTLNQFIHSNSGTFTREKIIAYRSQKIIIITSNTLKKSEYNNKFNRANIAIEVVPMARSVIAREIVKLHAKPIYRNGFISDNHNIILDIENLDMKNPIHMEETLNNIPGIVGNSIFAKNQANLIF